MPLIEELGIECVNEEGMWKRKVIYKGLSISSQTFNKLFSVRKVKSSYICRVCDCAISKGCYAY